MFLSIADYQHLNKALILVIDLYQHFYRHTPWLLIIDLNMAGKMPPFSL